MGEFLAKLIVEADLGTPYIVAPDVGTSAALFAAPEHGERMAGVIVGTGGAAVPLQFGEPLRSWVLDPNLDTYRKSDPRAIVNASRDKVAGGPLTKSEPITWPVITATASLANLSDSSGWTALLPGQILAGIGVGLATSALASTAVGVVRPQLSGMASGASNTARQLGIATGIAGLGSICQSKIESRLTPLVAGTPASSHVHELARAVASGGTGRASRAVPPADHDKVANAAHHAFVTGFTPPLASPCTSELVATAAERRPV